jgi:unsaturated rhamnogalacturonyl hydrolase
LRTAIGALSRLYYRAGGEGAETGSLAMIEQQIRLVLARVAAHAGAELNSKKPHWGDAILCDGLLYAARALKSDAPAAGARSWFRPKLATGPRTDGWIWFWSAEALPALDLYIRTRDRSYLDYARAVVEALETKATHTPDGAIVPHPPALEVWVDIAYFSAPAMARLGRLVSDAALIERALDQLIAHQRNLQDSASGLFWHVAYVEKRTHSACLWARGNSWFSVATPEVIAEIEQDGLRGKFAEKIELLTRPLARQLDAVVRMQDRSGLWHTVIDRTDSYLESSATAGFALALGRALRMRLAGIDLGRARDAYDRAIEAVCAKVNEKGEFTGVSQQTPPGDFDFYNSIEIGTASFGTGLCLMALAEALESAR